MSIRQNGFPHGMPTAFPQSSTHGALPDAMHVEADRGIGVSAKTVGEPRKKSQDFVCCLHHVASSVAKAFRTFDWEIPNCRAILAGVMPALKAARTMFICRASAWFQRCPRGDLENLIPYW